MSELKKIKELLRNKEFDAARNQLTQLDHPRREEWLTKLAEMERRHTKRAVNPQPMPLKLSKPLPLTPEEEKAVFGKRPEVRDPQEILHDHPKLQLDARLQPKVMANKAGELIDNFFELGHPIIGCFWAVAYIVFWLLWCIASPLFVFLSLNLEHASDKELWLMAGCLLILVTLPFFPDLLARLQQPYYKSWVLLYHQRYQDYQQKKGTGL